MTVISKEGKQSGRDLNSKISLYDVRKKFGDHHVLNGVNLHVAPGESLVVIGASGVGKSVLLKCIIGLLRPDSGNIEIDGSDIVGSSEKSLQNTRRKFGMLFQGAALFDSLTVWENVAFGLIQGMGMARSEARERSIHNLARVGLEKSVADLVPSELSGGMKKRVGLARAIATNPEVLFFDEPTTGLDPIMSDVINELIIKCVGELGATGVSITHDMASARKIADRIAMLHDGHIIWQGHVDDIDKSDNAFVDQFINGKSDGPIRVEAVSN